jgi:hypothetical protein
MGLVLFGLSLGPMIGIFSSGALVARLGARPVSAAGDSGPDSAARVSLVATAGYVAFLVGPPALGFVGDEHGLRAALLIPLVFVVIAAMVAPLIGSRRRVPVLVEEA